MKMPGSKCCTDRERAFGFFGTRASVERDTADLRLHRRVYSNKPIDRRRVAAADEFDENTEVEQVRVR